MIPRKLVIMTRAVKHGQYIKIYRSAVSHTWHEVQTKLALVNEINVMVGNAQ